MSFDKALFEKLKAKVQHVHDGKTGRWFDPGEYESLKQDFFDEDVPKLIAMIEALTPPEPDRSKPDPAVTAAIFLAMFGPSIVLGVMAVAIFLVTLSFRAALQ